MADSIRRSDSKTNRTADSIRDSIRTKRTIRRSLHLKLICFDWDSCNHQHRCNESIVLYKCWTVLLVL